MPSSSRYAPSGEAALSLQAHYADLLTRAKRESAARELQTVKHYGPATVFEICRSGPRMIAGVASTPAVNSHGYSLASAGCEINLPVPLLSAHGHIDEKGSTRHRDPRSIQIGEVVYARRTPTEIYVRAVVHRSLAADYAWSLIESGETLAFSGAGRDFHVASVVDHKSFYDKWTLHEVSVCRSGACPGAMFKVWRNS